MTGSRAMTEGELILVAGALLAGGIAASLVASRVRLPGLLLFLALGMLIGSDGTGWIDFGTSDADFELARTVGVVALGLILFEGGLSAGFGEIRPVLRPALGLALVGTFITAAIAGLAAAWLFDLGTLEGLLIGSIVASTDGAAIFALLRGSTLRRPLARTLEGEAGLNDPVAVLLVLLARPLAAALATAFDRFSAADRITLGWAGLRGAVPVVLAIFPVIDDIPDSPDFFNIVFFAVVISTLLQGTTFEPLARRLGVTTSEPALPRPLAETGTIRRLGAEIVEYPVAPDDAIVGRVVRDLGLPRDALLSVIVRGDEAILPRGSTRIEADDRLHVVVRKEVAGHVPRLPRRWHSGPVGVQARPAANIRASTAVFTARPWNQDDGDPGFPSNVLGVDVLEHLRTRRDKRGALVLLADGRYAVSGPLLAVGGASQLQRYARRRLGEESDEAARAWWQEVIGALAR